jgi:hypothetical protein
VRHELTSIDAIWKKYARCTLLPCRSVCFPHLRDVLPDDDDATRGSLHFPKPLGYRCFFQRSLRILLEFRFSVSLSFHTFLLFPTASVSSSADRRPCCTIAVMMKVVSVWILIVRAAGVFTGGLQQKFFGPARAACPERCHPPSSQPHHSAALVVPGSTLTSRCEIVG